MGQIRDHLGDFLQLAAFHLAEQDGKHDRERSDDNQFGKADHQSVLHDLPESGGGEKLLEVLETHKLVRTYDAVVIEGQGHAQDSLQLEDHKVDQGGGQH